MTASRTRPAAPGRSSAACCSAATSPSTPKPPADPARPVGGGQAGDGVRGGVQAVADAASALNLARLLTEHRLVWPSTADQRLGRGSTSPLLNKGQYEVANRGVLPLIRGTTVLPKNLLNSPNLRATWTSTTCLGAGKDVGAVGDHPRTGSSTYDGRPGRLGADPPLACPITADERQAR